MTTTEVLRAIRDMAEDAERSDDPRVEAWRLFNILDQVTDA